MKFFRLVLIAVIVIVSCKADVEPTPLSHLQQDSTVVSSKTPVKSNFVVVLQEEPQNIVNTWLAYITAQDEMTDLTNATLNRVIAKASSYTEIFKELSTTVPDALNANAVNARLKVLYTKANILEQLTQRQTINEAKILQLAAEIPQDFENFKLQLNELFLKTPDQFDIELDDTLDSNQNANQNERNRTNTSIRQLQNNR